MRHRLEYWLVHALLTVVRFMPATLVRASGTLLGLAFYLVDGTHRRIAQNNLATAFPRRPVEERRAIARRAFGHFGRLMMELLKFATLSNAEMLARVETDGEARTRISYGHGPGVIFVSGHFDFCESHA